MTLTCCQDHILTENIWFVSLETSYSGDKRRCYWCGMGDQTNKQQSKIELLSCEPLSFANMEKRKRKTEYGKQKTEKRKLEITNRKQKTENGKRENWYQKREQSNEKKKRDTPKWPSHFSRGSSSLLRTFLELAFLLALKVESKSCAGTPVTAKSFHPFRILLCHESF